MSPSAAVTVPSTPLLDATELEAALCRALRCEPSALQSLHCGGQKEGGSAEGFTSKCGSMTVDAVVRGRAHKLHLFVKRADIKGMADGMDSFGREALFYLTVLPLLEKSWRRRDIPGEPLRPDLGPAGYLGTDCVMVMEDLTRLGYKTADNWVQKGFDFSTVQQAVYLVSREGGVTPITFLGSAPALPSRRGLGAGAACSGAPPRRGAAGPAAGRRGPGGGRAGPPQGALLHAPARHRGQAPLRLRRRHRVRRAAAAPAAPDYSWEVFLASMKQVTPLARAIAISYQHINSGNPDDMEAFFQDSEARERMLMESEARAAPVARWFDAEEGYRQIMQEYVEDLLQLPRAEAAA